jgi:hypothetical protein
VNGTTAAIVATWTAVSTYDVAKPYKLVITIPAARFDGETPNVDGDGALAVAPVQGARRGAGAITIDYYTRTRPRNGDSFGQGRGARELQRALKRAEGTLDATSLASSRGREAIVEDEAHTLIREQRLVGGNRSTGRLDRLTRTAVRSKGRRGRSFRRETRRLPVSAAPGVRAWPRVPRPALERQRGAVISRIERLLERMARRFDN